MYHYRSSRELKFAEVFAAALRRRVGPGRPMTTKQAAYELSVSETTIWNLMSGNNAPSGPTFVRALSFFDTCFANEVLVGCGLVAVKASDLKTASYFRKVNDASVALRNIGQLCALAEPEGAE